MNILVCRMDDAATQAREILVQDYLHVFGVSFLFWDHFLTLDIEVRYLWNRRKFASAYSFFIIRYFGFFSNIPGVTLLFTTLPFEGFVASVFP
ncbi:hypothetical protein C8R44DRAFT_891689 [Mycena epipterygia]|nr:hypothetical protein C8R44DRAFT_891689 [Mycena epipterygia]